MQASIEEPKAGKHCKKFGNQGRRQKSYGRGQQDELSLLQTMHAYAGAICFFVEWFSKKKVPSQEKRSYSLLDF